MKMTIFLMAFVLCSFESNSQSYKVVDDLDFDFNEISHIKTNMDYVLIYHIGIQDKSFESFFIGDCADANKLNPHLVNEISYKVCGNINYDIIALFRDNIKSAPFVTPVGEYGSFLVITSIRNIKEKFILGNRNIAEKSFALINSELLNCFATNDQAYSIFLNLHEMETRLKNIGEKNDRK